MELDGSGFLLRGWEHGDERSLALHANNPKIAHNLGAFFPSPYTIEDAQDWVSQNSPPADPHLNFAIVVEGEAAGGIGIHPQSGVYSCKGTLGYWLGEAHWGRGIATGAVGLVAHYAFSRLQLARIEALVYAHNPGSRRVLEKAGFELDAILRANALKDGQLLDTYLYSRLAAFNEGESSKPSSD